MTWSPFDWRPAAASRAGRAEVARSRRRHEIAVPVLEERLLLSINIVIDYSYDTNHFFDTPEKRDLVQQAANVVASGLSGDHLTAIAPSAGKTNGRPASPIRRPGGRRDPQPERAGGHDHHLRRRPRRWRARARRGAAAPADITPSGDQGWLDNLRSRGHAGALAATPTQLRPLGRVDRVRHGLDPLVLRRVESTASTSIDDRLLHRRRARDRTRPRDRDERLVVRPRLGERLHRAGRGGRLRRAGPARARSWRTGPTGPRPTAVNAVMDPILYNGTRSMFTDLDYAALADVGWVVRPPSPELDRAVRLGRLQRLGARRARRRSASSREGGIGPSDGQLRHQRRSRPRPGSITWPPRGR